MNKKSFDISTVLVTGATGFIGSRLVELLRELGFTVKIFSRRSHGLFPRLRVEKKCWYTGDLHDHESLAEALNGVDAVFHAAGLAHSGNTDKDELLRINSLGTDHVYSAAVRAGAKKFIFFSSILASEPKVSAYAASKKSAEQVLLSRGDDSSCTRTVILRPANVYGPGMRGSITTFIRWTRSGFLPTLPRLENTFPLVSVQDLCATAVACAIDNLSTKQVDIFTVTDGERYTATRIEAAIHKFVGREPSKICIPRWLLFTGAKLAHFANISGVKKNQIGPSLYRNLIDSRVATDHHTPPNYHLAPTATFESEIPAIMRALD
tara:strand:+ start:217 stop:1182 length:966 start_codon:yes stop_codon:yes gene_type:complete